MTDTSSSNFSIDYARNHLDELVAMAARGTEVTIVDPVAGILRLTSVTAAPVERRRRIGHLKGRLTVPARLFEPMSDEELADWYGQL